MKTKALKNQIVSFIAACWIGVGSMNAVAQETKQPRTMLDQNISIYAENESLANVIETYLRLF